LRHDNRKNTLFKLFFHFRRQHIGHGHGLNPKDGPPQP
jgi:hypothetical protein